MGHRTMVTDDMRGTEHVLGARGGLSGGKSARLGVWPVLEPRVTRGGTDGEDEKEEPRVGRGLQWRGRRGLRCGPVSLSPVGTVPGDGSR